jgi:hypothetical protein
MDEKSKSSAGNEMVKESSLEESNVKESEVEIATEPHRKPFYMILGDEQGVVLDQLKTVVGRPLLSEPTRDRRKLHNWYFFKGEEGIYWWLGEGNSSLNHQFMIFKNPIVVLVINYRYSEQEPVEKLNDFYKIITKDLLEGDNHPKLKIIVVGYKFQKNLTTHRRYKKAILSWCLNRQHETEDEEFCDYLEDWCV